MQADAQISKHEHKLTKNTKHIAPPLPDTQAGGAIIHFGDTSMSGRFLNASEVGQLIGVSRRQLLGLVRDKKFPEPIRLSQRTLRWVASDVDVWVQRACATRTPTI